VHNWILLAGVDEFCYLGDMLDADEGCDLTVMAGIQSACCILAGSLGKDSR